MNHTISWIAATSVLILSAIAEPGHAQTTYTLNGHDYFMTASPVTWPQARQIATAAGGYIACITSAAENQWITSTFLTGGVSYAWIGCSDALNEGTWQWESGEPFTFTNWYCGEPNNGSGVGQHFGQIWTLNPSGCAPSANGGTWDDDGGPFNLTVAHCAIIEVPIVRPYAGFFGPMINNGHSYYSQQAQVSRAVANASAQSLGGYLTCITSLTENIDITGALGNYPSASLFWIGCSDAVSEGTWVWDSGEPFAFSNFAPTSSTEDFAAMLKGLGADPPTGLVWAVVSAATIAYPLIEVPHANTAIGPMPTTLLAASVFDFNGHQYFRTSSPVTYASARQIAQSVGGYIVSINSAAENRWLTQMFWEGSSLWIGCSDEASEGTFMWESGEAVSYTNWYPGEPNNGSTGEDYGRWAAGQAPNSDGRVWMDWGGPSNPNEMHEAIIEVPSLVPVAGFTLSAPSQHPLGSPLVFSIAAPAGPSPFYYVDMSMSGSSPGIVVPLLGTIPLNPPLIYSTLGPVAPFLFQNLVGQLDATGNATVSVVLPIEAPFAGLSMNGCGVFIDPLAPYSIGAIMNLTTTTSTTPAAWGGVVH